MVDISTQCESAINNIRASLHNHSVELAKVAEVESGELLLWLTHLKSTSSGVAVSLVDGAKSAALEAISYIALSLGSASMNAIRTQVDLVLSYTYFCDHPKEWEVLTQSGNGFKLKSEIVSYHKEIDKGFLQRLNIIEDASGVSLDKIYRTLSAHIHGQSPFTMPKSTAVTDLIFEKELLSSVVILQKQTSLMLSNFLTALHAPHWVDLPDVPVQRVRNLLNPKQVPLFFK